MAFKHRKFLRRSCAVVGSLGARRLLALGLVGGSVLGGAVSAQDFSLVPGVVINHSPQSSGKYVGSPSIVILPNGDYVASHDLFGPQQGSSPATKVFRSTDQGETWTSQATLSGQYWSNLFMHNDALYLMGTSTEYGRINIRKSLDGGTTWTTPTTTSNGFLTAGSGYHTAPMPMIVHEGRIWRAFENTFSGGGWGAHFRAFVMSAPVGDNLLQASSWTMSNDMPRDTTWLAGKFNGWLEGNVVLTPDNRMVNILRVDNQAVAAVMDVNTASHTVSFDPEAGFIDFAGGSKKFAIRHDPASNRYWSLANPVLPQHAGSSPGGTRNALALMSSSDLKAWDIESVLLYHPDRVNVGFQYVDWQFDGDDLVAASRTAYEDGLGGANNNHDANFLTFHRVEDFRTQSPQHMLVADTGNDRILRYQATPNEEWIPLGQFAGGSVAGAAIDAPMGLARDDNGYVYVGEEKDGGRILRFDAGGNFLNVVATEGVDFTGRPEALTVGPENRLYLSAAFGAGSDRVYAIDLTTDSVSTLVSTTFTGGSLNNPRGIAVSPDGTLYVADRQNNAIRKFNGETGEFLGNLATVSTPQGLTWDEAGERLIVSATASNQILEATTAGAVSPLYAVGGVGGALGIEAIDGTPYWSDFTNGTISQLTGPDAKLTVATGLSGPGHLLEIAKPAERSWLSSGSGAWHDVNRWQTPWGVPDTSGEIAVFAQSAQGRTAALDRDATVKGVRMASTQGHAIGGSAGLTFDSETGPALIDVFAGNNQIQVEVALESNVDAVIRAGATLSLNNTLRLNGHTLTKSGVGQLNINGSVIADEGSMVLAGGVVSGSGTIAGGLANESGTLAPGNSPGRFTVQGDYVQSSAGTLLLEIAGVADGEFDVLDVAGDVHAGGTLSVVFLEGFQPEIGAAFQLLEFDGLSGSFDFISLPPLSHGLAWDADELLTTGVLRVSAVPEGATMGPFLGALTTFALFTRRLFVSFSEGDAAALSPR